MRPSAPSPITVVVALALALAACGKPASRTAAAPVASSAAPVQWDYASNDPAKNPNAANKEASVPGYIP